MKVHVDEVAATIVHCSTCFGKLNIEWNGDKPLINKVYDVELDIKDTLLWNKDIVIVDNDNYVISSDGNLISLYGLLESVDNDGYAVLRIGDSIIPFYANGTIFKVGSRIKVQCCSILAYPINY